MNFITGEPVCVPVGNTSLTPVVDGVLDIGSVTKRWRDGRFVNLYVGASVNVDTELKGLDTRVDTLETNSTVGIVNRLTDVESKAQNINIKTVLNSTKINGDIQLTNPVGAAFDQNMYISCNNPNAVNVICTTGPGMGAAPTPYSVSCSNLDLSATSTVNVRCGTSTIELHGTTNVVVGKNLTSDKFITRGGTSTQFVKGTGVLDSTTYLPTSGGDISISSINQTVPAPIIVNQVTSTKTLASQFTNDNELVTRKFVFAHAGEVTNTRAVAINGTIVVGNIEFKVGPVSPAGSATGFSWRAVGNATACSHTITTSYSGGFSEIYFFAKNTYSLGTTFFETPAFTGITHSGLWTELRLVDEGRNQLYSFRSICRGTANPYLTYSITSF